MRIERDTGLQKTKYRGHTDPNGGLSEKKKICEKTNTNLDKIHDNDWQAMSK